LTCNHMMHPPQNYPATQVARQPRSPPQLPTPKPIPVHVLHPLPAPAPTTPRRMLRTSYPRRMLRTSYQPILPITIPTKLTTHPHARPPIMPPITNLPYKPNPARVNLCAQHTSNPMTNVLAGNVGKCVCWLHPSNDRHFCLSPTCLKCRPDTSATFCYVDQFFGCRRRVGDFHFRHTFLHVHRNQ
jgi:hypothetical protein